MSKSVALIIGNSEYENYKKYPSLPYVVNDLVEIYRILCQDNNSLFNKTTSRLEIDVQTSDALRILDSFFENINHDDLVLIYFAGHGEVLTQNSYQLVMTDTLAKSKNLSLSSISVTQLISILQEKNIKKYILILDSCRSGKALENISVSSRGYEDISNHFDTNGFSGYGKVIIASSLHFQSAIELDQLKHGIFSYYFIESLEKELIHFRNKRHISITDVFNYVSSKMASDHNDHYQTPVLSGQSVHGEMYIARNKYYNPIKESVLDSSNTDTKYDNFSFHEIKDTKGILIHQFGKHISWYPRHSITISPCENYLALENNIFKIKNLEDVQSITLDLGPHSNNKYLLNRRQLGYGLFSMNSDFFFKNTLYTRKKFFGKDEVEKIFTVYSISTGKVISTINDLPRKILDIFFQSNDNENNNIVTFIGYQNNSWIKYDTLSGNKLYESKSFINHYTIETHGSYSYNSSKLICHDIHVEYSDNYRYAFVHDYGDRASNSTILIRLSDFKRILIPNTLYTKFNGYSDFIFKMNENKDSIFTFIGENFATINGNVYTLPNFSYYGNLFDPKIKKLVAGERYILDISRKQNTILIYDKYNNNHLADLKTPSDVFDAIFLPKRLLCVALIKDHGVMVWNISEILI